MATKPRKPVKKKPVRRKPKKPKPADQPFRVLDSPYKTQGDFDTAVRTHAESQIKPLMEDWESRRGTETRSHTGRLGDITAMYNTGDANRRAALERTSAALNNLITLNSGVSGATRDAMAAALRGGEDREAAVAQQLGVAASGQGQAFRDASQAAIDLGGIGLTGEFASILGGANRDVGLNEVGRQEAWRGEHERFRGIDDTLQQEREDISEQLPGFMSQARQEFTGLELQRAGQREQQRLGRLQHDLSERQFGEQTRMGRSQRQIARAQQRETERAGRRGARQFGRQQAETERANRASESINQQQIINESARIQAEADANQGTTQGELLKAKAERFKNGTDLIVEFMKPTKQEQGKKNTRKSYEQRVTHGYDAMVAQLKSATGAGDIEVRQMIMAAVNSGTPWGKRWVARAQREIPMIRNSRIKKTPRDPRNPNQSPLGPK